MVAAFDYCLHGKGGAAPSIDTAMHGSSTPPTSTICTRTPGSRSRPPPTARADRGVLRRPGRLGAVAAARASSSAWTSPRSRRPTRRRSASILGGHGITAWGETQRRVRGELAGDHRDGPALHGRAGTRRPVRASARRYAPLPEPERRARAAALAPVIRGLASTDRPQVGHFTDAAVVLDFLARAEHPRLAALGTSCPDHFLRTKVEPLVLDLPPAAPLDGGARPAARAARGVPDRLPGLLRAARHRRTRRRCAAPTRRSCWCPASGCSASARTSRPRGWPASSTSTRST